jgi:hypothetical protein
MDVRRSSTIQTVWEDKRWHAIEVMVNGSRRHAWERRPRPCRPWQGRSLIRCLLRRGGTSSSTLLPAVCLTHACCDRKTGHASMSPYPRETKTDSTCIYCMRYWRQFRHPFWHHLRVLPTLDRSMFRHIWWEQRSSTVHTGKGNRRLDWWGLSTIPCRRRGVTSAEHYRQK